MAGSLWFKQGLKNTARGPEGARGNCGKTPKNISKQLFFTAETRRRGKRHFDFSFIYFIDIWHLNS
jgi:hypothetical protein